MVTATNSSGICHALSSAPPPKRSTTADIAKQVAHRHAAAQAAESAEPEPDQFSAEEPPPPEVPVNQGSSHRAAGFDDEEGTVKHFQRDGSTIVLIPSNPDYSEIRRSADEVTIYGKVVTVLRKV